MASKIWGLGCRGTQRGDGINEFRVVLYIPIARAAEAPVSDRWNVDKKFDVDTILRFPACRRWP